MQFFNLKVPQQKVSFAEAIKLGLGKEQGLFMPETILQRTLDSQVEELMNKSFVERSIDILAPFVESDIPRADLSTLVRTAFDFPVKSACINENRDQHVLELFHGPSLAFKDFGARFLAQCINFLGKDEPITILTATSGDTGAAVAHAFYGLENVNVVILYPKGKISPLQEKLFSTLGANIETLAIDGDFDACQALVKQAFMDDDLRAKLNISSANSINVARLLAQVCYYFEFVAQNPNLKYICVPSGNFGNLTAGLIAKVMGCPIKRFIAATNDNDTVPRYLQTNQWEPSATVATITNAMDVAQPNNFPRVEYLSKRYDLKFNDVIHAAAVSEEQTKSVIRSLGSKGYPVDPHTALALYAVRQLDRVGVLGTAHPAKFNEVLAAEGIHVKLPDALEKVKDAVSLSLDMQADYATFKEFLLED